MNLWMASNGRRLAARLALAASAALLSAAARADVIEIGGNGAAIVRAADGNWSGEPRDDAIAASTLDADGADVPAAAITTLAAPVVPVTINASFRQAALAANLSPTLLEALVWQESRWQQAAVSPKGALGLTQLMPGTARDLRVDPRDHAANLAGGALYLRRMLDLFDGNIEKALAAYNAGPGRVQSAGGIPAIAETRAYVSSILDRVALATAAFPQGVSR